MRVVDEKIEYKRVIYNEVKALQGDKIHKLTLAAVTISDLKGPSFLQDECVDYGCDG